MRKKPTGFLICVSYITFNWYCTFFFSMNSVKPIFMMVKFSEWDDVGTRKQVELRYSHSKSTRLGESWAHVVLEGCGPNVINQLWIELRRLLQEMGVGQRPKKKKKSGQALLDTKLSLGSHTHPEWTWQSGPNLGQGKLQTRAKFGPNILCCLDPHNTGIKVVWLFSSECFNCQHITTMPSHP